MSLPDVVEVYDGYHVLDSGFTEDSYVGHIVVSGFTVESYGGYDVLISRFSVIEAGKENDRVLLL